MRIIVAQPTGGRFPLELEAMLDVFLGNFARFGRGEPLVGTVDPACGH